MSARLLKGVFNSEGSNGDRHCRQKCRKSAIKVEDASKQRGERRRVVRGKASALMWAMVDLQGPL